jgi:hypothetical protein
MLQGACAGAVECLYRTPAEEHVHIVVKAPYIGVSVTSFPLHGIQTQDPTLDNYSNFCFVLGDLIFPVEINGAESVRTLRKILEEERPSLGHLDADTVDLWDVSMLVDRNFKQKFNELELDEECSECLGPVDMLLKDF